MTAAEASRDTALRARVVVASGASSRAVLDTLRGLGLNRCVRAAVRSALEAEGVDLATIPERSADDIARWKARRQGVSRTSAPASMPIGFAMARCSCGQEYPHMESETIRKCPRCWRELMQTITTRGDE